MSRVRRTFKRLLNVGLVFGVCIGHPLVATAASAEVVANKAVVERLLEVKGTPEYKSVAAEVLGPDHKKLRAEFENLLYNADDPKLSAISDPDYIAITGRTNRITRILGEGDKVAATFRLKGIQTGNLYGIPATGKKFEIDSVAIFKLDKGKIIESWYMADEAALLRQLGAHIPARADGKVNLPPVYDDVRTFDEAFAELTAHPVNTPEYRHDRLLLAYKSVNKPTDYKFPGKPYANLVRGGIDTIVARAAELGVDGSHAQSMSGRRDLVNTVISEGNLAMMAFRLTAVNSGPLYGIPPSGHDLHDWEVGFAEFDGDTWVNAWWMGDELGFLLAIGNRQALDFLVGQ